jgi:hypothetical protein
MTRDLHPSDGARYLLERIDTPAGGAVDGTPAGTPAGGAVDGAQARYRAAIYTRDAEFAGAALLGDDGSVELGATGAPDELHARLLAMARLVARDASRLRGDGLPPWPQRVLRWRR